MENDNIFRSFTNELTELINNIEEDSYYERFTKKQKINEFYYITKTESVEDYDNEFIINYYFQRKPYKKWGLKTNYLRINNITP